jgi:hypothetical protein
MLRQFCCLRTLRVGSNPEGADMWLARMRGVVLAGLCTLALSGCVAHVANGTATAPQTSVAAEPIKSSDGAYVSPIRADGTLAPWVSDGLKSSEEFKEYRDGRRVRALILPAVPNMFLEMHGDKAARERVVEAFGGWDHIRSTSDSSFNALSDLDYYIKSFRGSAVYEPALAAASWLYPEFAACIRKSSC